MVIRAGIVGGAGYTAGELIRILIHHPKVKIDFIYSTSNAGNPVSKIHQDLLGETDLHFTDQIDSAVDVLFLCLGHGNSKIFLGENSFSPATKIIDLSNDFRLVKDGFFKGRTFVYGLPELNSSDIKSSKNIANPGCFATAIQLALLPLANAGLICDDVHVNAVTGATGAGNSLSPTTHFTWRDNNFSSYKVFTHQHLDEIGQSLTQLQASMSHELFFIPNRGNFSRGIFASTYTKFDGSLEEAKRYYREFYKNSAFTIVSDEEIHLKQVVNTNKCLLHIKVFKGKILITSAIDNLLKGASGQAVQNMNLIFGLDEKTGLQLKANYF